eukprot:TRINITY_DN22143_c0_g1_i1.p1 TRINITY_DN22143_c0_g1~~TRINITY_DN22143_c0_g1_i1.p1  ORF type:complete len:210 (-),score=40.26 TRINITY_DN22143_c0_g1_i1:480-1109(-)
MATSHVPLATSPRFGSSNVAQAVGRQVVQQEGLPAIFHGGGGPNMVRGGATKQRIVAQRTGAPLLADAGQQTLLPNQATLKTSLPESHVEEEQPRRTGGKKMYDNAPGQQSILDTVVFGRDMDNSGESQFDEEFMSLYKSSAGIPSGVMEGRARGLRSYTSAPGQQSNVDAIIWGRDVDFSDLTEHDKEFISAYGGAAGKLSSGTHFKA